MTSLWRELDLPPIMPPPMPVPPEKISGKILALFPSPEA